LNDVRSTGRSAETLFFEYKQLPGDARRRVEIVDVLIARGVGRYHAQHARLPKQFAILRVRTKELIS